MKTSTIILTSLLVSSQLLAEIPAAKASELSWVDEQVEAIKPARVGAKNSYLGSLRDPFIFLKVKEKDDEKKKVKAVRTYRASTAKPSSSATKTKVVPKKKGIFILQAILNKTALIDGKWYKEGQRVHGYTLQQVSMKKVLLKKSNKTMVLSTRTKNRSLKFNNN